MQRPPLGVLVTDLDRSLLFYRDMLGFAVELSIAPETAVVLVNERRVLLATPAAGGIRRLIAPSGAVVGPRDAIHVRETDLHGQLNRVVAAGVDGIQCLERPWGDVGFAVRDPDGYRVEFWAVTERSMSEVLALYQHGRVQLREMLDGLADSGLDQRAPDGGWSIREIVHHLADAEVTVLAAIRVALASPGSEYVSHPYDQEEWAVVLHYAERDIGPSLRLLESIRDEVSQLLDVVPDAWSRTVRTPQGGETSVGNFTSMLAIHTLEHTEQIRTIRGAWAPDARVSPPGARCISR